MKTSNLACGAEERRKRLFGNPDWNGMDFLEVSADQLSLCVHFFGQVPENITAGNVRIEGGRRIRNIRAANVKIDRAHDEELDDCLRITLDKSGDFSTYRLCLVEKIPPTEEMNGGKVNGIHSERDTRPMQGIDPRYACLDFSFKADCPSDLDCLTDQGCPPEVFPAPEINYLAKDYASFRQLMLDRLALIMPDWQERHVPDIGITLVELLAYTADYLSYYQDAVATEAYLETARQRISIRRHVRLVDYRMHEGNNARTWITVWTATDLPPLKAKDIYFITGFPDIKAASGNVVKQEDLDRVPENWYEVFEPLVTHDAEAEPQFTFRAAHSKIHFYTWDDQECCLPKGATRATLLDEAPVAIEPQAKNQPPSQGESANLIQDKTAAKADDTQTDISEAQAETQADNDELTRPKTPTRARARAQKGTEAYNQTKTGDGGPQRILNLSPGDVLIFEEVLGPTTNNPADADPLRRHAVRLIRVTPSLDGLLNKPVLEIEWDPADALPFSLCLSARLPAPDCRRIGDVSVARGNVVLVDHGRRVEEPLGPVETKETVRECGCEGSVIESTTVAKRFNPVLKHAPLTFGEPLPANGPASTLLRQDAWRALPHIVLQEFLNSEVGAAGPIWNPQYDLLASGAEDRHYVAELDDEGRAHLRFGDGELGRTPAAGVHFMATYRVGKGSSGNVGRDMINHLVLREGTLSADAIKPRNPLPAEGGMAPEPVTEAKLFAPHLFRTQLERAITAEDYANLAERNTGIQRGAAELRWMGSWYEARVAIDPAFTDEADAALLKEIEGYLYRYRRMGHDLAVVPAHYVPLYLAMEICVLPQYARGHIKAELLKVFGSKPLENGKLGFFHPDNLSFGDGIYVSQLIAMAKSVEGVETVKVTKLQRLDTPAGGGAIDTGVLPLGSGEIAQLNNDPSFPENGKLELILRGGR
ncbi:putative baseplate assembly protein [Nitrosovibrio sp. Nv6]|uniref:putative baseplate assembly protein n=1 Tax=Nitrosovibrio sp. Nv6 TaxID=1855340 RepID=UPI0008BD3232|nr:putative baseplate assembly protein [Nitrosovibrio sp. Nv6]SEO73654.1 putative baseplate assembly protein [Nitrosovibrio sp. Nv6]